MRKIEQSMLAAIHKGSNWALDNTRVECGQGYTSVYLYGHCIATRMDGVWRFNLQGYNTATTRSRINALGARVNTRQGQAYCAGRPVESREWFTV